MTNWILNKINLLLVNNEGCELEDTETILEGSRAIITDAFGFKYEIQVKVIGRVNSDPGDMEIYLQSGNQYGKASGAQNKGSR